MEVGERANLALYLKKNPLLFTIIKRRLLSPSAIMFTWLHGSVLEPCSPKSLIPHHRHTVSSKTKKEDR